MKSGLIVIGGGPGGYVAAIRAAQLGLCTVLVERDALGGACLNRGCIPTKTLLHSASLYRQVLHSAAFGVTASDAGFDYAVMDERRRQVVEQLRRGVEGLLKDNGVKVIHGSAVIEGPGRVRVDEAIYESEHILVAVGARPALPPIPGLDLPGVVTSDGLLGEGMYHPRLTIIGGGVIGMEFASLYSALGAQVTVLEAMDRVLPTMDKEIAQNLSMLMKRRGVKLCTGARVEQVTRTGEGLQCTYTSKEKTETVAADAVLVSTGRKPNTEGLCGPGVDLGLARGAIPVNERFETCVKGIYAIGDVVAGGIQLAHVASAQAINAVSTIAGKEPPMKLNAIPACVYTEPEIASVGLTEAQAKEAGIPTKGSKYLMNGNGRSIIAPARNGALSRWCPMPRPARCWGRSSCVSGPPIWWVNSLWPSQRGKRWRNWPPWCGLIPPLPRGSQKRWRAAWGLPSISSTDKKA